MMAYRNVLEFKRRNMPRPDRELTLWEAGKPNYWLPGMAMAGLAFWAGILLWIVG